ncbi:DUF485 domain-containing protein [Bacillus sp. B15-48]|uniref:DUF485 domain-containing protein n=1 Tax=Bacillus sp. B15-48 TaxID=1548601 RepID=UPI00193F645D|nr:DUF485 domain-containing protein [Bacillus sp. B15-48]
MEEQILQLIRKKMHSIAALLSVALLFYFLLPLSLIFIPEVMNRPSFLYGIPWAWVYAFLQLPMTWFFCWLYHITAKRIEREMGEITGEEGL